MAYLTNQLSKPYPALRDIADDLLIRMSPVAIEEWVDSTDDDVLLQHLVYTLIGDSHGEFDRTLLGCAFQSKPGYEYSWLLRPGKRTPYLMFDLLVSLRTEKPELTCALLAWLLEAVLSDCPLQPFDVRCLAAEFISRWIDDDAAPSSERMRMLDILKAHINAFMAQPAKSIRDKINEPSDGIDHTFPVPELLSDRLHLLWSAAGYKAQEARFLVAARLHARLASTLAEPAAHRAFPALLDDGYHSEQFAKLIGEDELSEFAQLSDFIVPWDQIVAKTDYRYSIAEILRLILLGGDFSLPDTKIRQTLLAVYRSLLRISGRAVIGLSAGVLYVEHGLRGTPSVFYMGRDATVGKGCVIDGTGGTILQSRAFIGGGLMPILIHTHKHVAKGARAGVDERKHIVPAAFVARSGARFPMSAVGLFECADYLTQPTPYPGIEVIAVNKRQPAATLDARSAAAEPQAATT